jgi:PAS domain-containing protein
MFGLSTEIVKPGAHLRDLMRHRRHTGSFSGDVDEFCARVMQNIALGRIDQTTMQSADGRSFLAISKPLAHGGWVATMEDITERRKLEQERDRNQAFLSEIIDHIPSQITVKSVHDRRYLLLNRVADAQFGISRDLVVGKTAFEVFPKASADIILADEEKAPQSPDGLFKGEHVWESQAKGKSYITSKRLVIRDSAGAPSHVVNVVDDVRHAT